jgi:hypothetical protein
VNILLPQGRREPKPDASAASTPSALSGFDFDVCFPRRFRVSAVTILLPQGRREPKPGASASSAPSALSGFDFDVGFSQRLGVSAVNILLPTAAPQNTEAPKRLTMVIHPLNSLTGTEV